MPPKAATTLTPTADFEVGPAAIGAYSRLSYTMWYALAEFVDNSTQSRINYKDVIDDILKKEGVPLKVEITHDRAAKTITIKDNSIGMNLERLIEGLKIAQPTTDSKGRSRYGMGLKTAACWIGAHWTVSTCEYGSGKEWTAEIDVPVVVGGDPKVPLTVKEAGKEEHYTKVVISDLNRHIQKRTEETIMIYLGSMYRNDIRKKKLVLLFNNNPVSLPEEFEVAKSLDGTEQKETFKTKIGGKDVTGWFAVLSVGSRKFGGFSIFQNDRQIRGYPDAWRPRAVFGGVDDEGSNTLVSQRLTGEIVLDGFDVSHTKDAILFKGTEEEELEQFLAKKTQAMKAFATSMRVKEKKGTWSKDKLKELFNGMEKEFGSKELKDVVEDGILPPIDKIKASNAKQAAALEEEDMLMSLDVGAGISIKVYIQDRSENDPHLTLVSEKENVLSIIINQQHPYYLEMDSTERTDEMMRQFIYDAVAEFRVFQRTSTQLPDAIRKFKDQLLRAKMTRLANQDAASQQYELGKLADVTGDDGGAA